MSMTTFGSRLSTCNRVLQKERLLTYGVISPRQSRGISPLQGGGGWGDVFFFSLLSEVIFDVFFWVRKKNHWKEVDSKVGEGSNRRIDLRFTS